MEQVIIGGMHFKKWIIREGKMHKEIEAILDNEDHDERLYKAALWYIENNIPVVPIMRNGKQLPPKETGINYGSPSKKKVTIEKWFHPERGKFAGWNIGIACGRINGVFAIDIDKHGGEDGELNFHNKLKSEGEDYPKCPVQLTPSGGKHLLFRWGEGGECTSGKIAKCVDTRGGTNDQYKGHIVAFPSIIDGNIYTWEEWDFIPDAPEWVLKITSKGNWKGDKGEGRGNENVTSDDVEMPITETQIKRMLTFVDPDECDYEKWLKVGMAIKSQYPDDLGLGLWEEWSKEGQRYKTGECYIRWEGFSDFGTVRAGTLFYYATQSGWEKQEDEKQGNSFDRLVAKMNEEYGVVSLGGKIRILREKNKENLYGMDMHYELYDKDSFKTLLENKTVTVVINEKPKKIPVANIWLGHEGRRTYVNGLAMFPKGEVPEGYYNTWSGFAIDSIEGDCSLLLDHIKHIVCDDKPELNTWLLDWLADLMQDPANPKGCCIVMKGDEGVGKGILANTIGRIFGPHHRHLIDDTHLTSNFNAHLVDAITLFADEITWGGNKKTAGKIKGLITEKYLVAERKGVDAVAYINMVHIFIASNSDWVIPAGKGSRRWFVLNVPDDKKGDRKYFDAIVYEINNGGIEALFHFLLNRKITSDLRVAPETKGLSEQRVLNTQSDTVFHWWRKCIISDRVGTPDLESDSPLTWPMLVSKMGLYETYENHVSARKGIPVIENVFAKRMIEFGVKPKRVKIKNVAGRLRVYELPDVGQATKIMNNMIPGAIEDD